MQQKSKQTNELAHELGLIIKDIRQNKLKCSINQFAHEYDLDVGNTSRVEKGVIDVKFVTLWKIAEALQMKPSELVVLVENKMGSDFKFFDA